MKNKTVFLKAIFGALLILQVVLVYIYAVRETYSYECLKYATAVYENGSFIVTAPYMSILGLIARLADVHPLIIVNRVLPVILIPLAYAAYYRLLGRVFEKDKDKQYLALIAMCVVNLFGFQSGPAMPIMLLTGYFTGAGIIIHVILPWAAERLIIKSKKALEQQKMLANAKADNTDNAADCEDCSENDEDYQEEWDMKKHRIVNARNLAIALGVLSIVLIAFAYVLNNKINSLYDATVNIQSEINSNCRSYEYRPGDAIEGYLIKNSDGTITFIGGGGEENMDSLYNFITTYGNKVDSWYLYGDDEANSGAYNKCVDFKKLPVENVYIINRTDYEQ